MRTYITILLAVLMFSPMAFAKGKGKSQKSYEGTISKVDKNRINIDYVDSDNQSLRYIAYVGEDTTITLDGKPATLDDLAPGMFVTLHAGRGVVAASVEARNRGNDWKK